MPAPKPWREDVRALRPMLATLGDHARDDPAFVYEPKYDGIRALIDVQPGAEGAVGIWSRLGNEKTSQFPEIVTGLRGLSRKLRVPVVLDGEIVALDAAGKPAGFQQLQGRIHVTSGARVAGPVAFLAFDALRDGKDDLRDLPLTDRRARLERIVRPALSGVLRLSEQVRGDGDALWAEAMREGWEGLIAKRADSVYRTGRRSPEWLKLKLVIEQEFVIGGWTEPRGTRSHFGALLLGVYDGDALEYVGHTGTGFDGRELQRVAALMKPLEVPTSPFRVRPRPNERPHWARPALVAQVKFTEWTADGKLRHPTYLGLRDDVDPGSVRREPLGTRHMVRKGPRALGLEGSRAHGLTGSRAAVSGKGQAASSDGTGAGGQGPGTRGEKGPRARGLEGSRAAASGTRQAASSDGTGAGGQGAGARGEKGPRARGLEGPRARGLEGSRARGLEGSRAAASGTRQAVSSGGTGAGGRGTGGGGEKGPRARGLKGPRARGLEGPRARGSEGSGAAASGTRQAASSDGTGAGGQGAGGGGQDKGSRARGLKGPRARGFEGSRARGDEGSQDRSSGTRKAARAVAAPEPAAASAELQALIDRLHELEGEGRDGTLVLPDGDELAVTNLRKVFWPGAGLTKGDLFRHYVRVSPYILPVVADRPLVMKRHPNGIAGQAFYQQRAPDRVPGGVRVETVEGDTDVPSRLIGGSLKTLLYMTQIAAISQDPWFSRVQSPEICDHVAIDLDPMPDVSFETVLDVARWVRDELVTLRAEGFAKTSGADGLHIFIPLPAGTSYEAGVLYAQIVATLIASKHPKVATVERSVRARGRTVYVDYLQNIRGKTLACAYSARASDYAGVSAPLSWDEIDEGVDRRDFTLETMGARLAAMGDLWAGLRRSKGAPLRAVERYLSR